MIGPLTCGDHAGDQRGPLRQVPGTTGGCVRKDHPVAHTRNAVVQDRAELGWRGDPAAIVCAALERTERVAHLIPEWTRHAACTSSPLDFTDGRNQRAALEICARCPVLTQCRDHAIATPGPDYGVVGGMTAVALKAARTARRIHRKDPTSATT